MKLYKIFILLYIFKTLYSYLILIYFKLGFHYLSQIINPFNLKTIEHITVDHRGRRLKILQTHGNSIFSFLRP